MRKVYLSAIAFLAVVFLFAFCTTALAEYTTIQLTDNSNSDQFPQINASDQVVWSGFDGIDNEIYLYSAGITTKITDDDHYWDYHPRINDSGHMVWYGEAGPWDREVFLSNGGVTTRLSNGGYWNYFPQINSGGQVVWNWYDGIYPCTYCEEILLYSGGATTNISSRAGYDGLFNPAINDTGQVVWEGQTGTNRQIYLYSGGATTQLTDNNADNFHPHINASGQVVWGSNNGFNYEIYLYSGGVTTQITDNGNNHQINDAGQVVWQKFDGTDHEIFLYASGVITQLTDNNYDDSNPQINASGQVVWLGDSDGYITWQWEGEYPIPVWVPESEIYLFSSGVTSQITNNSFNDYSPQINNSGHVVWYGNDGTDDEIFMASQCTGGQPSLSLSLGNVNWASYADYTARELTVQTLFSNNGIDTAYGVNMTGATCTNGVTLSTPMPVNMGNLVSGASAEFGVRYHIPVGVGSFRATVAGSATDACGTTFTYP